MSKTLNLTIQIPDDYNFLASQPWGTIMLFKNKPKVHSEMDGDTKLEYWDKQSSEIELVGDSDLEKLNIKEDWKNSVIEFRLKTETITFKLPNDGVLQESKDFKSVLSQFITDLCQELEDGGICIGDLRGEITLIYTDIPKELSIRIKRED